MPNTPLPICLSGSKDKQEVQVSLRYFDLHRQRKHVLNPKAKEKQDPMKVECAFDVTSHECQYRRVDGHPTVIFPVVQCNDNKTWEESGVAVHNFTVSFLCFNSDFKEPEGESKAMRLELVLRLVETIQG